MRDVHSARVKLLLTDDFSGVIQMAPDVAMLPLLQAFHRIGRVTFVNIGREAELHACGRAAVQVFAIIAAVRKQ